MAALLRAQRAARLYMTIPLTSRLLFGVRDERLHLRELARQSGLLPELLATPRLFIIGDIRSLSEL